jgi:hypothetical protein
MKAPWKGVGVRGADHVNSLAEGMVLRTISTRQRAEDFARGAV